MRETTAKRRPMIDLEQFERRLRQTDPANRSGDDPLAELARFAGERDDPYRAVFEPRPASPQQAARPPATFESDFDGRRQEPAYRRDFDAPAAFSTAPAFDPDPWADPAPDAFAPHERRRADDAPSSRDAGDGRSAGPEDGDFGFQHPYEPKPEWSYPAAPPMAEEDEESEPRSRRPLYIMAAIIVAGVVGIGASFALKGGSTRHDVASIKAVDGPVKVQPESNGAADAPSQDASILERTPQAYPVAAADGAEQPVDLSRMPERAPRVIPMHGGSGAAGVAVPPSRQASQDAQQGEQMSIASLIEPKKVKTVSVRPDGSVISSGTAAPAGDRHVASPPPKPNAAAPKPATPKATTRVATTPAVGEGDSPRAAKPKPVDVASVDAAAPAGAAGGYAAQLAAPASEAEARDIQARLIKKYSSLIPGFHPAIRKAVNGDKTVYRVRSVGLSRDDANAICQKVQGAGGACFVAKN